MIVNVDLAVCLLWTAALDKLNRLYVFEKCREEWYERFSGADGQNGTINSLVKGYSRGGDSRLGEGCIRRLGVYEGVESTAK